MGKPIIAVIVEDHPATTAGVRVWCAAAVPPIELIDVGDRLAELWTGPAASADVVIFDLHLDDRDGRIPVPEYGALTELVDAGRSVIVYSSSSNPETITHCMSLGVDTYLTKHEGPEHLVPAIVKAAAHLPHTAPTLAGAIQADQRVRLSMQERDALRAWFQTGSKQLAAQRLGVSARTVETYIDRARIKYANLGRPAGSIAALIRRALEDRVVTVEDLATE
ncbi:response regulator [Kribbella sp. NPDC050124]|uniref:response regulator n=1 Tax=Kribbella sp. NPDC050124 TaxID=3364114 RepID=UPI0037AEDCF3